MNENYRDLLIQHIENFLIPKGFKKKDNEESWLLHQMVQEPGQIIIINGQPQEHRGRTRHFKFECTMMGECSVWTDGQPEDTATPFEMVSYKVFEKDNQVLQHWNSIYYDQMGEFDDIFNEIFKQQQ